MADEKTESTEIEYLNTLVLKPKANTIGTIIIHYENQTFLTD